MSSASHMQTFREYAYDGGLCLVVLVITALTILPLFQGEYTSSWGSIESAYLSEAQHIVSDYPHLGWYPYWYLGFPFSLIYVPLLPYAVALMHVLIPGWSIGHSYRILIALGYSASPPALYALGKYLSKRRTPGLIIALSYALVPTFLAGKVPSHIEVLAIYGEGPHILSLLFLVLSELQFLRCIQKSTLMRCVTFAVLMAAVALTNVIGLFSFFLVAGVTLLTEAIFGAIGRALRVLIISGAIAVGLAAFQYTWRYILALAIFGTPGVVIGVPSIVIVFAGVFLVIATLVAGSYLGKRRGIKPYFLALMWMAVFGAIVIGRQLWGLTLAPQPIRYAPEFDMGVSIALGLLVVGGLDHVAKLIPMSVSAGAFRKGVKLIGISIIMICLLLSANTLLQTSYRVTEPAKEFTNTPEYQLASWLSAHVTDERIYASGTVGFWLNAFSSVQQIRGGSDGAGINPWWPHVTYQINNGQDAAISVLWARALNVKYIVVTFPNASTAYHDFVFPEKFRDLLPLRYYFQGFAVYEVPLRQGALVQCVNAQRARALGPIRDVLDKRGLTDYLGVIDAECENQTRVSYDTINTDEIRVVTSKGTRDTAILLKMTYDQGWRAEVNGRALTPTVFGPSFMIIYPEIDGDYQFTLHFQDSFDQVLGSWISAGTLIGVLVAGSVRIFRRRQDQPAAMSESSLPEEPRLDAENNMDN